MFARISRYTCVEVKIAMQIEKAKVRMRRACDSGYNGKLNYSRERESGNFCIFFSMLEFSLTPCTLKTLPQYTDTIYSHSFPQMVPLSGSIGQLISPTVPVTEFVLCFLALKQPNATNWKSLDCNYPEILHRYTLPCQWSVGCLSRTTDD